MPTEAHSPDHPTETHGQLQATLGDLRHASPGPEGGRGKKREDFLLVRNSSLEGKEVLNTRILPHSLPPSQRIGIVAPDGVCRHCITPSGYFNFSRTSLPQSTWQKTMLSCGRNSEFRRGLRGGVHSPSSAQGCMEHLMYWRLRCSFYTIV